ncbi:MAG: hypothetical protein LAT63_07645 [Marinobacter sp.]|nr:hypothetical protein [Marinobacter sp.]
MRYFHSIGTRAGLLALAIVGWLPANMAAQEVMNLEPERSTLQTIPFLPLTDDSLSDAMIEGALGATAAGPGGSGDGGSVADGGRFDPLALEPRDTRTNLGLNEFPVDIRYRNPRDVPGVTFSDRYVVQPRENRNYDTLNTNVRGR